jgi:hypothetical protein
LLRWNVVAVMLVLVVIGGIGLHFLRKRTRLQAAA